MKDTPSGDATVPCRVVAVNGVVHERALGASAADREVLIIRIETDSGHKGHAECLYSPPAALAFLTSLPSAAETRGIKDVLLGRDPRDVRAIVADLREGNLPNARGGIAAGVIAAVDVALWDLCAQLEGAPLWKVLWGDAARPPTAYATVYVGRCSYNDALSRMSSGIRTALEDGYSAVKVEPLDECVPSTMIGDFVHAARRCLGGRRHLLVDLYHRLKSPGEVWALAESIKRSRPYLLETPMPADDHVGYAALRGLPVPVAGCELFERPLDFQLMLQHGHLDIVQPWPGRLGVIGTRDVMTIAADAGVPVLLAGWNVTAVGRSLNVHLAAGVSGTLATEDRPPSLYPSVRTDAVSWPGENSQELPGEPGLGVDVRLEQPKLPPAPPSAEAITG